MLLPCCAAGALFMVQLLAFIRWFKRVVLKREQDVPESEYWRDNKDTLAVKAQRIWHDARKRRFLLVALGVEAALFVAVWAFGGFVVIERAIQALRENPGASVAYLLECCFP